MILVRSFLFATWLYVSMSVIGLATAPFALFDRRAAVHAGRAWARATIFGLRWIVGAKVEFRGDPGVTGTPRLIAMKHQSMLDTLAPMLMFEDPAIVLKKELTRLPLLGWFLLRLDMIPVDREAQAHALKGMMRQARKAVADGRDVLIFPEGTRAEPGAAPDYKIGVAAIYRDLGIPCIPVALDTGRVWAARGIIRRPGVTTIAYLDPIAPGLSRDEFMQTLQERIETGVAELAKRDPVV